MYASIIAATDRTDVAAKAVEHAADLAKRLGAKLTLVTVTEQAPTFAAPEIGWSVPQSVSTTSARPMPTRAAPFSMPR